MKKLLSFLLAGCMLIGMGALAACAGEGDPETPEKPEGTAKYTVTYEANGGEGTAPATASYATGETFTVGDNPFTREGYTFAGWNDGTKDVAAGSAYTMPAKDVKFQAQWEEIVPQLYGLWTGSYEYYDQGTVDLELIILKGDEKADIYVGVCGGSSMIASEDHQGIGLMWCGTDESKTTPGMYECLVMGMTLVWSESDKTLKYLYSEGGGETLVDKSFFMTYSPLPAFEAEPIEDGTYTAKDEYGIDKIILNGGTATGFSGDNSNEALIAHLGNYTVFGYIQGDAPDEYFFGYTMFKTDDGFMMFCETDWYYFAKATASA